MAAINGPDDAAERRLHPWSWLFVLLQQLRQFIVPLLALLLFGSRDRDWGWSLAGITVLVLVSLWQYLTYRYRITADSLLIRSGVFERNLRQIPFARIHNVALHQSLLHRIFGVAEVRLESAGGQKPEAQMRVLALSEALALENLFRQRDTTTTTADAEAKPQHVLLSLSTAEVLRLGLISNRGMIVVAAAFAAAWQVFPERTMGNVLQQITRSLFGYVSHLQWGQFATVISAVAILVLALLALRLLSILLALAQYYGFRLTEDAGRLTVERGLLTRSRTSATRRRVQAWTLYESLLHRWLRRRTLHVDSAVAEQHGQSEHRALKELAPIATPAVCDELIRQLLPQAYWPRSQWKALPRSTWWRLFLPSAFWVVLATVLTAVYFGQLWSGLLLLGLPWLALIARRRAARTSYSIDAEVIAVRGGWWWRYWRFAEIDKLQSLRLSRSPVDRWFGTTTLSLDTAGAHSLTPSLQVRFLACDEAVTLYQQLSLELAQRRLRW